MSVALFTVALLQACPESSLSPSPADDLMTEALPGTAPTGSQCTIDVDCDDLNVCTKDRCLDGQCEHLEFPGCCLTYADCSDSEACTFDVCVDGLCVYPVESWLPGCECKSTTDCDDLNICSLDKCLQEKCQYEAHLVAGTVAAGCCREDSDCDDSDTTTTDTCEQFICVHRHEKVCKFDSDCVDDDPCTEDGCVDNHCVVQTAGTGCCIIGAECNDDNPCTKDFCEDGMCVHEPNVGKAGCCAQYDHCDDGVKCTKDVCINYQCKWFLQEGCCHGPLDCPQPDLPCQVAVCKEGICGIEPAPGCCDEDSDCDDDNPCTDQKCEAEQCFFWDLGGCCLTDSDCNDDNPCTEDICSNNYCLDPKIKLGCCVDQGQCNDGDICTIDKCIDNVCAVEQKEGCCHSDDECVPENECEVGYCVNGNCMFGPGDDCCVHDEHCDDGDACTIDKCVAFQCVHIAAEVEGCCESFFWQKNFDDGTDQGFVLENTFLLPLPGFDGLGWIVTGDCGFNSEPAALYYGAVNGLMGMLPPCTYNMELEGLPIPMPMEHSGTATSELIGLMPGQPYLLSFQVMADISPADTADALFLEVVPEVGDAKTVWEKADLAGNIGPEWHAVELDLSDYAGQNIMLRFSFDSLGGEGTDGAGVLIDDIKLSADCF